MKIKFHRPNFKCGWLYFGYTKQLGTDREGAQIAVFHKAMFIPHDVNTRAANVQQFDALYIYMW